MVPMRVLYLCEFPTVSGGERSLLTFLDHVDRGEFDPIVAAPPAGDLSGELAARSIEHVPLDLTRRDTSALLLAERVASVLAERRADLVHANSLSLADVAARAGAPLGVRAIAHARDCYRLSRARWADVAGVRALIVVSHAVGEWIARFSPGRPPIRVVHNGVAVGEFALPIEARDLTRRELGVDGAQFVVAAIGQFSIRKGLDVVLEAFREVVREVEGARLFIAGERYGEKEETRAYERRLHEIAASPDLAGRVRFLGRVKGIASFLAACDVLAHGARQEPLGRVLLEAMAATRPVVATAVGGTGEIVEDGLTGLVVTSEDSAAMARALVRLANEPDLAREMGLAGQARVRALFDPRQMARRIEGIYREALAGD